MLIYGRHMRMDEDEVRARFAAARVLRLATADAEGVPHLVPATFAVHRDQVAIAVDHKPKRTRALKRLANITENGRVAVLVDEYADDWAQLWWARGDGRARVIEAAEAGDHMARLLDKYAQYREVRPEGPVIEIEVFRWSGWRAS